MNHSLSLICSPRSPGCPGVYYEDQAGPKLTKIRLPPASTSWRVLEFKPAKLTADLPEWFGFGGGGGFLGVLSFWFSRLGFSV